MEQRPFMPAPREFFSDTTIKASNGGPDSKEDPAPPGFPEFQYPRGVNTKGGLRRSVWPLAVVGGQLILLGLAWGFFAALHAQGQIPLSSTAAAFAQRNPQSKAYLVTFIATALSTVSSYLFSQAVRYSILASLRRPESVSTLGFRIIVSRRWLILRRGPWKWVIAAALFAGATLLQTASWTALLTPSQIVVPTPLRGTDFDLSSAEFENEFTRLWNASNGILNYLAQVAPVTQSSGAGAVNSLANTASVVDFGGWVYLFSTAGILPIILVDPSLYSTGDLVTTNTAPFPNSAIGSSDLNTAALKEGLTNFNITMFQQGLSAATSCELMQLDANTNPQLERFANPVEITVNGKQSTTSYTDVGITTSCNGQTITTDFLTFTGDTMLSIGCLTTDSSTGETTYTVIIDGQGAYNQSGTLVCVVAPKIWSNIAISYSSNFVSYNTIDVLVEPAPPWVAYAAIYGLEKALGYGQTESKNFVSDSINTVLINYASEDLMENYQKLMENYIKGVIEFVGTAMKADLTSPQGPLSEGVPLEMQLPMTGYALTLTYGWEARLGVDIAILIPTTFVGFMSIGFVLYAQFLKWRSRGTSVGHADFDANDPLLLMAAASAGGMQDTFRGLTKENLEEGGSNKVVLGQIGNRHGLVQVT